MNSSRSPRHLCLIAAMAAAIHISPSAHAGPAICFSPTPYAVGSQPSCVTMADLNGDGFRDLAVADHDPKFDNRVAVLINNGDGTFAPSVYYEAGYRPYWIALGDIDGDLDNDMAVTNYFDVTVSVFLNNGDGTFAPQVAYTIGSGPGFVVMAPLDGDDDLDLAATNIWDNTLSILSNNGDGTFARQVTYPCGPGPYGLVAANLDTLPGLDLAVSNFHDTTLTVLMNNGDGTFGPETAYAVEEGPVGNDAADLDNDGDIDLVVADLSSSYAGTNISVLMNNGDGTFARKVNYDIAPGPYTIKCVDFNTDGFADVVCSSESGFVSVYLNNQDGTLAPAASIEVGSDPVGLDIGDLDGNGTPEAAITAYGSNEVWVLFNQYTGFATQPIDAAVDAGQTAVFTAVASNADWVQWRRDGVDIADGETVWGSIISGSATNELTITNAQPEDVGSYDLVAANGCGSAVSYAAGLIVTIPTPSCPGDIAPEGGNGVVDVDDLLAVINDWGACDSCLADIEPAEGNSVVDVDDLLAVINAWGPCR